MRLAHRLLGPSAALRPYDGRSRRIAAPAVERPSCWWALLVGAPPRSAA